MRVQGMNIRDTENWKAAELKYEEILTQQMTPFFRKITSDEIIERCESILKKCPEFYPALFEIVFRKIAAGQNSLAEQKIEEGFRLFLELVETKNIDKEIDILISNFEKLWRFDLSRRYLKMLVDRYPRKAMLQDRLAYAEAMLGNLDIALQYSARTVELEPNNLDFKRNRGWILLVAGNIKEAGDALAEAAQLDPSNKPLKGNLKIHRYLAEHGGNYLDYLLRPSEREKIDQLANEEEWEEVDKLCESFNECRKEALVMTFLKEDKQKIASLPDLMSTFVQFFGFVSKANQDDYMLNEDISFIHEYFKPIMHKFIFKFGDVNLNMLESIYKSLLEYYGFLANHGVVQLKEFNQFKKDILGVKSELINKMQRYNDIRHNANVSEEEKEDIREELFEGNHDWPFL